MSRTRLSTAKLNAAIATPDNDVEHVHHNSRANSVLSQVKALNVGEVYAKCVPVAVDMTVAELAHKGTEMRNTLRNNCGSSIHLAKQATGGEYTVEVTNVMTTPGRLYLLAIVTRVS